MDVYTRNLWLFFFFVLGYMIYQRCKSFKKERYLKGINERGGF